MLVVVQGPSGTGKSSIINSLVESGSVVLLPPPVWEGFSAFVEHPKKHAFRNQIGALEATGAVLGTPLESATLESATFMTDASLRRVHVFTRALAELGFLNGAQVEDLDARRREIEANLQPRTWRVLRVRCDEGVRRQRITRRGREAHAHPDYWRAQELADHLLVSEVPDCPYLEVTNNGTLEAAVARVRALLIAEEAGMSDCRPNF